MTKPPSNRFTRLIHHSLQQAASKGTHPLTFKGIKAGLLRLSSESGTGEGGWGARKQAGRGK